jgi:hypothetical protein
MKFGKTIKIFLIDGDSNDRMSCELSKGSIAADSTTSSMAQSSMRLRKALIDMKDL